ncbi:MAG: ATP-binding protein, partial [Methylococcales bacterium]
MARNPFKYLDYYTCEDADLFYGREAQVQRMVGEILSSRLLVLFSPSGSGKTSLINAGIRPELEAQGFKTLYTRFNKQPVEAVIETVDSLLSKQPGEALANDMYSHLKLAAKNIAKPLVLFLDQFEEFFIIYRDTPEIRKDFIGQLAKIKYDDALPVFIVLSLREDYFANMHEFREAIPSIFQNNANVRLESFTREEAWRAITKPIQAVGATIEDGLANRIIEDLDNAKSGIQPIELQIVCASL